MEIRALPDVPQGRVLDAERMLQDLDSTPALAPQPQREPRAIAPSQTVAAILRS